MGDIGNQIKGGGMKQYWTAWVGGRWRTLSSEPRQIQRGRDAGRWEVTVKAVSVPKGGAWKIVDRRHVVDKVTEVT